VTRYLKNEIKIDPMISSTLPLEKINKAFDRLHDARTIRTVIGF
jgi:S-(hydroxymethyl)glutathione dehydrogenase / alcohol dehydrogenase